MYLRFTLNVHLYTHTHISIFIYTYTYSIMVAMVAQQAGQHGRPAKYQAALSSIRRSRNSHRARNSPPGITRVLSSIRHSRNRHRARNRAVGLCSPCLGMWGRLRRRRCAAGGCAHAVLAWGGVYRQLTYHYSGQPLTLGLTRTPVPEGGAAGWASPAGRPDLG